MKQNAEVQIDAVERNNTAIEQGMDKKVKEYEQYRFGQGKIAGTAGKSLGSIPFTDLGSSIHGMNSEQQAREYLKGGEKRRYKYRLKDL